MRTNDDNGQSGSPLRAIVVAVVVALLAGGSAPWWWNKLFPESEKPSGQTIPHPRVAKKLWEQLDRYHLARVKTC